MLLSNKLETSDSNIKFNNKKINSSRQNNERVGSETREV